LRSCGNANKKENVGKDVEEITADDNPEDDAILREVTDKIEDAVINLATLEKQVLSLYLNKKTYRQIAKELDISTKKVDNIMMKIKARLAMKLDSTSIDIDEDRWSDKLKNSIQRGLEDHEVEP
jgi:RNA polymerase sigma factor (sigma-70 family)